MKNWFSKTKIQEHTTDNINYYFIIKRTWFLGKWKLIRGFCNKEAAKYYLDNQYGK